MKIRSGYMLRQVIDTYVIMGIGSGNYAPNQIMSLNETGVFLWKLMENQVSKQELIDALCKEYEVTHDVASADVEAFLTQLSTKGLIEE